MSDRLEKLERLAVVTREFINVCDVLEMGIGKRAINKAHKQYGPLRNEIDNLLNELNAQIGQEDAQNGHEESR